VHIIFTRLDDFSPQGDNTIVYTGLMKMYQNGYGCVQDMAESKRIAELVAENVPACNYCRTLDVNKQFKRCSACKTTYYCTEEHQQIDWSEEHKVIS
jgi:hypothetical protein